MDVLADFLKTAGVTAFVDPSPCVDQSWSNAGVAQLGLAGYAQLRMLCVAAGDYSLVDQAIRKPLTTGDVVFLLEGSPIRVESSRVGSTLIVSSIVFRAGVMALATLNLPSATILRGADHPESRELAMRFASEVLQAQGGGSRCLSAWQHHYSSHRFASVRGRDKSEWGERLATRSGGS